MMTTIWALKLVIKQFLIHFNPIMISNRYKDVSYSVKPDILNTFTNDDPVYLDIMAYIYKKLLNDKIKINDNIFIYKNGQLQGNKYSIELHENKVDYKKLNIGELDCIFVDYDLLK